MRFVAVTLGAVFGLMLAENRLSRANAQRLRAMGAVEPAGDVYRALAVLYPAAFFLMGVEGLWRASGVLLFVASKALKYWAIRSLGERWSFRVLVLPGQPLVQTGPYRHVAHPNYIAVVGELVATAMMVGARVSGPIMTAVFGVALWARVRFEDRVLAAERRGSPGSAVDLGGSR